MEVEQAIDIDVANAVAVGKQKRVVVFEIPGNALQPATSHCFEAGVGKSDSEILFLMSAHEFDMRLASKADLEVAIHSFVIQKVVLDHVAAISEAQNELAHAVVGVHLHDVPYNGTPPNFHHRFGAEFGL